MQSVCVVLPGEYTRRVVDARARLAEDPAIGAIYDPPFAHFTFQLAEDYDWDGLAEALGAFARTWQPFSLRTVGLLLHTGDSVGVMVAPYKDRALSQFHAAAWQVITPFARGRVDAFYEPERWLPQVTVKRCGHNVEGFAAGLAKLAADSFAWDTAVDNISVQHDPGKQHLTHYRRLSFPLGAARPAPETAPSTNATLVELSEGTADDGARTWSVELQLDGGRRLRQTWTAPTMVRLMAGAKAAHVYFPNARCHVKGEAVTYVVPNTPFPVM
jgi:hypothetical protein